MVKRLRRWFTVGALGLSKHPPVALTLLASASVLAAGYSASAVPTRVDVVRGDGFMIWGSFGNPGGCTVGDQLYVKIDHPQYQALYAAAMAAFAGKYKVYAYVHGCEDLSWYGAPTTTYNIVHSYTALSISD